MVFDSPQMVFLRDKFLGRPDYQVPKVLFLDRQEDLAGERAIIEDLYSTLPETAKREWIGNFVCQEDGLHVGAWFEIMLYDWLRKKLQPIFKPRLFNCDPDFSLLEDGTHIFIEAKAVIETLEEKTHNFINGQILEALHTIKKPIAVGVDVSKQGARLDTSVFKVQISEWLERSGDEKFEFQDKHGNIFNIYRFQEISSEHVRVLLSSNPPAVDPSKLKAPLLEKFKQHKEIREMNFPYIVGIFRGSGLHIAQDVVSAFFGHYQLITNPQTGDIISYNFNLQSCDRLSQSTDSSGIVLDKYNNHHTSITGILAFDEGYDQEGKCRFLRGWYIENPFARTWVDPNLFPVEGRFVVIGRDEKTIQMNWQR